MRVGDRLRYEVFKTNLADLKGRIDRTQTIISSGRKILAPSDDPVSFAKNMRIESEKDISSQYKRNLDKLKTLGTFYEAGANRISDLLTRAKELAVQQSSSNMDAATRRSAADEVDTLIEELVTVGNTNVGGNYIFGGKRADARPFDEQGVFSGSSDVTTIAVDPSTQINSGISGDTIFQSNGVDMFQVLIDFKNHLENNNVDGIKTDLDSIGTANDLAADNLAYIGNYTGKIDAMIEANTVKDSTLTLASADLMDADVVQVIADYNNLSTAYQSALYTMAKLQELNVLNYL